MNSSNHPRREFETILAALTERELTDWETDRLWELLGENEEWIDEYVDHCQMAMLLGGLDEKTLEEAAFALPEPKNIIALEPSAEVTPVSPPSVKPWLWAFATAAAVVIGAVMFLQPDEPIEPPSVANSEPPVDAEETPQETYDRVIAMVPPAGSQTRPPTQFTSLKGLSGELPEKIGFNEHVRPILSEYCFHCHGPDSGSRKADLRLDTENGLHADLGGYFPVKPGDAAKSEVMTRILDTDPDSVMPPPESHKTMKPVEKAILARWIDEGAKWEGHWAFIAPERPDVPEIKSDWAKNEIDAFILSKLDAKRLTPNEEADRYTLARRAAFDITGLPPTPEQIETFLADKDPKAYDKYVEELLASPHYGEHRARFWLDAARYGDTHGLHLDNHREMWPWRDWVIQAFNENMPFDQFAVEQIAGDLLPNATQDQLIATGFNRCNVSSSEGGSIPEELAVRYMVDRVETTSTVFMGLTTGCAVCHDHKFDPISQKDFYQLAAFFNNAADPAMDGNQKDTPPVIILPEGEMATEWDQLMTMRAELRKKMRDRLSEIEKENPSIKVAEQPVADDALRIWLPLTEMADGQVLHAIVDGEARSISRPDSVTLDAEGVNFGKRESIKIPKAGSFDGDAAFTVSFWVRRPKTVTAATILQQIDTIKKDDKNIPYGIKLNQGTNGNISVQWLGKEGKKVICNLPGENALDPKKWQHLAIRFSGSNAESGVQFLVNGKSQLPRPGTEDLIEFKVANDSPIELGPSFVGGGIGNFRLYDRWLTDEEISLLVKEPDFKNGTASDEFKKLHYAAAQDERYQELSREFSMTQTRRDFIAYRSVSSMVMAEKRNSKPMAHILDRGEYDQRKEAVKPGVPAALPPLAKDAPRDRLGLAQWLTSGEHPLTARVMVNRLWLQTFGNGLVLTAEDFGVMGEKPSHPELLDWLTVEFVESGWDVKHIVRLMVTSATYRQAGHVTPEKLDADPDNRFLARGPRRRLDAEALRDQALAISGLLNPKMGGPSVKPPQPAGLWEVVAQGGSNTKKFAQDTGDDVYRRSVYSYWKRTAPPPPMAIFNAPSRESCTVRRERTNTPLQALVLLNEVQFVESARALAERMLKAHPNDPVARLEDMTQRVTGRPIEETDRAVLEYAAADFTDYFKKDSAAATELIQTGDSKPDTEVDPVELAAWTMIANTLLNRDDVINQN